MSIQHANTTLQFAKMVKGPKHLRGRIFRYYPNQVDGPEIQINARPLRKINQGEVLKIIPNAFAVGYLHCNERIHVAFFDDSWSAEQDRLDRQYAARRTSGGPCIFKSYNIVEADAKI